MAIQCIVCDLLPGRENKGDEVLSRCGWCLNPIVAQCQKCGHRYRLKDKHYHASHKWGGVRPSSGTPMEWGKTGANIMKLNANLGMKARQREYEHYYDEEDKDAAAQDDP